MLRDVVQVAAAVAWAMPLPALAQDAARTTDGFGEEFGRLVGSESGCGLSFKADAVEAAIRRNVAADDLQFTNVFSTYVSLTESRIERMKATERLVHCMTAERNARALGLID